MEDKLKVKQSKSNDLSDIVLEKKQSGPQKTKKLLLLAASLILIFLIALVLMKLFSGSNNQGDNSLAQVSQDITQKADNSIDKISKKVEDTNELFKQEPIVDESSETDLKFEEMVRKLKAQDAAQETDDIVQNSIDNSVEKIKKQKDEVKHKVDDLTASIAKAKKEAVKKTEIVKEEVKTIAPKISIDSVKTKVSKIKPAKKEVIISSVIEKHPVATKLSVLSGYFVQVGATANSFPDKRFLQKIKNAGYDYVVHTMFIKGRKIKKVLIGPYSTKSKAQAKLPSIRNTINPSAYIFRIK